MNQPPANRPSLGQVFDLIAGVKTDVAVIKEQIIDLSDHEHRIRALEHRIRALERRTWLAIGGFGLAAAVSPYLSTLIT